MLFKNQPWYGHPSSHSRQSRKYKMPFLFEDVSEEYLQGEILCTAATASLLQGLKNHSSPIRGELSTHPVSRVMGIEGCPPWGAGTASEFQTTLCRLELLSMGYPTLVSTRLEISTERKKILGLLYAKQPWYWQNQCQSLISKISKIS